MGRGDAELRTDFGGGKAQVLAHQEDLAGARGEQGEALLQRLQEFLLLERLLGPVLRRLAPVAGRVEQGVEVLERIIRQRLLAARAPNGVDDLVLEDAG